MPDRSIGPLFDSRHIEAASALRKIANDLRAMGYLRP